MLNDGDPVLVCNADILSNIDLKAFYNHHIESQSFVTLAVRSRKTSRYFLFDNEMLLRGWKNVKTGETRWCSDEFKNSEHQMSAWAFSGIHVISPEIFQLMPNAQVFSIIDVYLNIASRKMIKAYPHDEDVWIDAGTPAALKEAIELNNSGKLSI
jgi:NDP-sugar pyrophosphorylase family protein